MISIYQWIVTLLKKELIKFSALLILFTFKCKNCKLLKWTVLQSLKLKFYTIRKCLFCLYKIVNILNVINVKVKFIAKKSKSEKDWST